jgi:hypothetical protein
MAKKNYKVASTEGSAWAEAEEGETIERDLSAREETALIAAGWLEEVKTKKGASS